jgi:hypothetical protein
LLLGHAFLRLKKLYANEVGGQRGLTADTFFVAYM